MVYVLAAAIQLVAATPPTAGEKAPDFALSTVAGKSIRLSEVIPTGPVVLVVLRGYPGYQCPFCSRQAQDFIQKSQAFADAGARVVGMLLDPGYEFTKLYGLRWDAPNETAYPSTFLIDRQGVVFFSKIVKQHGGRTTAAEILDALPKHRNGQ